MLGLWRIGQSSGLGWERQPRLPPAPPTPPLARSRRTRGQIQFDLRKWHPSSGECKACKKQTPRIEYACMWNPDDTRSFRESVVKGMGHVLSYVRPRIVTLGLRLGSLDGKSEPFTVCLNMDKPAAATVTPWKARRRLRGTPGVTSRRRREGGHHGEGTGVCEKGYHCKLTMVSSCCP